MDAKSKRKLKTMDNATSELTGKLRRRNDNGDDGISGSRTMNLPQDIISWEIYPRLTPWGRASLSCVNTQLADVCRRLDADAEFFKILNSERRLRGIPRLPSLIMFTEINHSDGKEEPLHYTNQFIFVDNAQIGGKNLQINPRHSIRDVAVNPTEIVWHSVGSKVVIAPAEGEKRGYVGELESRLSWRWNRTVYRDVDESENHFTTDQWITVGRRTVKLELMSRYYVAGDLVGGSYYDVDADRWSRLTPLSNFPDDFEAEDLLMYFGHYDMDIIEWFMFQWKNRLYVGGCYVDEIRFLPEHVAFFCDYDFETGAWSRWNSTPELEMLSRAIMDMPRLGDARDVHMVGATDGTLFAVSIHDSAKVKVWFLREDQSMEAGFVWEEVPIPHRSTENGGRRDCRVWPLEQRGGIVIVSGFVGGRLEELEWWFLTKSGVYEGGTFRGFFPSACVRDGCNRMQRFALIHTDDI